MFYRIIYTSTIEPWGENAEFFQELEMLARAGFETPEESHTVLKALRRLRCLLETLLYECTEYSFEQEDFSEKDGEALLRIYAKSLQKIKGRHGLNSCDCSRALTQCLGIFALGFILYTDQWHIPLSVEFSDFVSALVS